MTAVAAGAAAFAGNAIPPATRHTLYFTSQAISSPTTLQAMNKPSLITRGALALVLALAAALPASAQSFDWGVVAGLNLTKLQLYGSGAEGLKSNNRTGWYVGPKVAFNTVLGIGVDAALEYSQRDLEIDNHGTAETETYRTLEIPVNLRYNIGFGKKAGLYVSTGPQFGFALQNMSWDNFGTGSNFSRSNLNTTWNIGAGVRLLNHLEVGIGYNFALSRAGKAVFNTLGGPTGTSNDAELKYKTNTFQVQLSCYF